MESLTTTLVTPPKYSRILSCFILFFLLFTTVQLNSFLQSIFLQNIVTDMEMGVLLAVAMIFYCQDKKRIGFWLTCIPLIFSTYYLLRMPGAGPNLPLFPYIQSVILGLALVLFYKLFTFLDGKMMLPQKSLLAVFIVISTLFMVINFADAAKTLSLSSIEDTGLKPIIDNLRQNSLDEFLSLSHGQENLLQPLVIDICKGTYFSPVRSAECNSVMSREIIEHIVVLDRPMYIKEELAKNSTLSTSENQSIIPLCEKLPDSPYNDGRKTCYQDNAQTIEQCQRSHLIDMCVQTIAFKTNNPKICLSAGSEKNNCLFQLNRKINNP